MRLDVSVFPATTAAGGRGVHERPGRRGHVYGRVGAAGRREIRLGEAADDEVAGGARDGERAVEVALVLFGRPGEVDLDLVACDGDGDADLQLPRGRLERVARLVTAVGKAGDGSADDALGVAVELVHRRRDRFRPAPLDELGEAALRQPVGGELGVEVAAPLVRVAHVREQDGQQLVVEAHRRQHEPLLVDVGRARGQAGRLHAADVGVVRARAGEAARHAGDERDVGEMRAAGEGVVDDVDLAGLRIAGEDGGDGLGHGAEVDGDVLGLDDHAAAGRRRGRSSSRAAP